MENKDYILMSQFKHLDPAIPEVHDFSVIWVNEPHHCLTQFEWYIACKKEKKNNKTTKNLNNI